MHEVDELVALLLCVSTVVRWVGVGGLLEGNSWAVYLECLDDPTRAFGVNLNKQNKVPGNPERERDGVRLARWPVVPDWVVYVYVCVYVCMCVSADGNLPPQGFCEAYSPQAYIPYHTYIHALRDISHYNKRSISGEVRYISIYIYIYGRRKSGRVQGYPTRRGWPLARACMTPTASIWSSARGSAPGVRSDDLPTLYHSSASHSILTQSFWGVLCGHSHSLSK